MEGIWAALRYGNIMKINWDELNMICIFRTSPSKCISELFSVNLYGSYNMYIDETKWVNSNDARLNSAQQFNDTPVSAPHLTPKPEKSGILFFFFFCSRT